jgi:hypothetical protein
VRSCLTLFVEDSGDLVAAMLLGDCALGDENNPVRDDSVSTWFSSMDAVLWDMELMLEVVVLSSSLTADKVLKVLKLCRHAPGPYADGHVE